MTDQKEAERAFHDGLDLRRRHRWKAAASSFERATSLCPAWAEAWFWLAVSLDNRGDERAAIPAYRNAIGLGLEDQREVQAWTWLASSLSKTGRHGEAMEAIETAEGMGGYHPSAEYRNVKHAVERRSRVHRDRPIG